VQVQRQELTQCPRALYAVGPPTWTASHDYSESCENCKPARLPSRNASFTSMIASNYQA